MSARLRRTWLIWSLGLLVATALVGATLGTIWGRAPALRWTVQSAIILGYFVLFLGQRLSQNRRRRDGALLAGFGPGTSLSLLRALMLAWMTGFLLLQPGPKLIAWLPAIIFTASAIADYFDGYLARITDQATALGEALDLELDAYGMLAASGLAIWYGALPWWFLVIGLARYGFMAGVWLRERVGKRIYPLPGSISRRPIAGLTMGFLSVMLWPIVSQPATVVAGVIFLLPFAVSFTRDWLVVSGAIDSESRAYADLREAFRSVALGWLPLLARGLIVGSLGEMALSFLSDPQAWISRQLFPPLMAWIFMVVQIAAAALLGFGILGRTASLLALVPVGLTIAAAGLNPQRGAALIGLLLVLILGSGKLSLWAPEDGWFRRRAGE